MVRVSAIPATAEDTRLRELRDKEQPLRKALLFLLLMLTAVAGPPPATAQLPSSPGWFQIANSALRPRCAPGVPGAIGCEGVTAAWNSAIFDQTRNRMIIWGGGHNDYYGNEIYAIDLNTLASSRLTDPGQPYATPSCPSAPETLAGGTQPNSRHTYDALTYIAHMDEMFIWGGSLSPCGSPSDGTWVFNFGARAWTQLFPGGDFPPGNVSEGSVAVYDPVSGNVYLKDNATGYLYRYSRAANTYTRLTNSFTSSNTHTKGVIDPSRRRLLIAGGGSAWLFDLTNTNPAAQNPSLAGCTNIVSADQGGLVYSPKIDRIVGWNGGNTITLLNLDTNSCTTQSFSGGPSRIINGQWDNGIYGRWQYSVTSDVFVYYGDVDSNAFGLRISPTETVAPSTPSSVTVR